MWSQCRQHPRSQEEECASPYIPSTVKRQVFADSTIHKISSPTLRDTLAKVLFLMREYSNFRRPFSIYENLQICVNAKSWSWIAPLPNTFSLHPEIFPNQNTQQLILLADLGYGLHGRVWLAASTAGAMCVLKFFTEYEGHKKEIEFWNKAYPKAKARVQEFMGRYALLMPPLPPCPAAKRNNSQIQEAVKRTVKALMNKGVAHRDLKWNNFGFRQENNHIVAIAYDFGMAENITAENKVALVNEADEQVKQMFLNK